MLSVPNVVRCSLLLCLLLISASFQPLKAANGGGLSPIIVQLKWKHQFQFAGFYAAAEKGFYKKAGFEVTLKEASPKINPIEEVLSGRADYGVANSELMLYRLNGDPVTALAAMIQHSPIVLISLKDSNIYSPQDLIGKKVMYPSGYYGANTLGIMLNEGIALSQFESVPLSFNINDLIEKKVDAMVGYVTDQPYMLKQKNIAYNLIDPRSYGIDFYGDILFTQENRVDKKPDEVARFRAATLAGWRYAIDRPDETIEMIINQYHSEKSKDELQYEAKETVKLIVPKLVQLGHMNPGRWEHIAETFYDLDMVRSRFMNEGFIYTPEKHKTDRELKTFFRTTVTTVVLAVLIITLLMFFNKRLKNAVNEKTHHLTEVNERLLIGAKLLADKDEALRTLNHDLEQDLINKSVAVLDERLSLPDLSNAKVLFDLKDMIKQEIECTGREGQAYWLQTSISPLWDEKEYISHFVIVFEDITGLKQRKDEMEKMALYDPLTGLENRVLFRVRLDKAIQSAKRNNVKTALLFVDVDNFKEVNDSSGHDAGDIVLKTISERLTSHVRKNDSVARISGDEFTVLLSDVSTYDDARKVTNSIINSFQDPIRLENTEIFVTVSIGISVTPDDSTNMDELIKNADLAMYKAKQEGRNNFQFFCQDMNIEVTRKAVIEQELRGAIDVKNFFLLYQPKILFGSETIVGAEALIRWQFSPDAVRNPDDFIPAAEETGLIIPIGRWVIKQAIDDIKRMMEMRVTRIKISVNISPRQIKDSHFVVEVREMFSDVHEYIQYVEFEITENAFLDNQLDNICRLNELRDMGFSISIDDFGTGYSSLSYLKRLPIDTIKIDRALVQDLPKDTDSAEIIIPQEIKAEKINLYSTEGYNKMIILRI